VGEFVVVHLHKDRHPAGSYFKLKAKKIGPHEIKKINGNAYVVDIPSEFNMSLTFNVSNLRKYYPPESEDAQFRTIAMKEGSLDAEPLLSSVFKQHINHSANVCVPNAIIK